MPAIAQRKPTKWAWLATVTALFLAMPVAVLAQPVDLPVPAATTDRFPAGVHVLSLASGAVYADGKGRVLYGMDMRTLLRAGPDPARYCTGACAGTWEPLLAPAGSEPTISFPHRYGQGIELVARPGGAPGPTAKAAATPPDWAIIAGPQGPQWVYKTWHMVFTRRGDRPGSVAFDGADERTWNTLKFLPPMPRLTAPANVQALAQKDHYVLADKDGHALFTGSCARACAGWQPLAAGMASAPIGEWSVSIAGEVPQWLYRGKPVFVSQEDDPGQIPAPGKVLRP